MAEDNTTAKTPELSSPAASPTPEAASHSETLSSSPPSTKFTSDNTVTLLVGPEKRKLLAHAHYLTKSSEFFKAALNKEWKEGQTRVVELPEENIVTTTHYLEFVYEGRFCSSALKDYKEDQVTTEDSYFELCQLYTFGERVCDASLRNSTIHEMIRLISLRDDDGGYWAPDWNSAAEAYQGTTAGSPIRRFVVDVLIAYGRSDWLDDLCTEECAELLVDALKEFTRRAQDHWNPSEFRCISLKAEDYLV